MILMKKLLIFMKKYKKFTTKSHGVSQRNITEKEYKRTP